MDINKKIKVLLNNPDETEEFTSLFSPDKNWDAVDKSIKVPRGTALLEEECPECLNTLRVLYNPFDDSGRAFQVTCPNCEEKVGFKLSYEGHSSCLNLDYGF